MRRLISVLLLSVLVILATASGALAQADAQETYQAAKAAYEAGEFADARDLAQKASQTDPKNPEVFLLLGRAHYQLGELAEAVAAWKRTLVLAPEEPYATKMLSVLRAERVDVDARIRLVEVLVAERLYEAARTQCAELMGEASLSAVQRARILTIRADLALRNRKPGGTDEAHRLLQELLVLYPDEADAVETTLLSGQIKLRLGGESAAEGVALLKKLVAEHPDTPAAAAARYELIDFQRQAGIDEAWAKAMAQWIADNPQHPSAYEAKRSLIAGYFELSRRSGKPAEDAGVTPTDEKALAMAVELFAKGLRAAEAGQLTDQVLKHVESHYAKNGANRAAVKAAETLLGAPLSDASRLAVLKALAGCKTSIAMKQLEEQARAGQLPQGVARGKLPPALAEVVAVYEAINKQFPAQPAWAELAQLAAQVRAYAPRVVPLAEFQGLKGPDAWTLDIAMPVIKADADPAAVQSAVGTVQGIVQEQFQVPKPDSQRLAVQLSRELVGALSAKSPAWPGVMSKHAELLAGLAKFAFDENLKAGKADQNARLSDLQKELLAALQTHVAAEAAYAPAALQQLGQHLNPWIEHGHWAVAEEAYATLAKALPEAQRRQADLAVVHLRIHEVTGEHQRLVAAGLTVPRELDPRLAQALARCYQLQAGLDDEPSLLGQVRAVWEMIVRHYKALEYEDVAEAAIRVKADEPVALADEYAAFQLVELKEEHARRQLARFLKQYGATEKIALGPEFEEVIAGWTKFVADRPESALVQLATEKVFGIGQLFEQQGAFQVAAGVYDDLAKFAAGVKVLAESAPGTPSIAERATFAAAQARDAHARRLLAQQMAERTGDQPPPSEISKEFAAALAAYLAFVKADPDGPLAAEALGKIMAIALEYAKVDAWDVSTSVYTTLLDSKLAIRRPERLEFCRALCHLGRAMPDHARQILTTLTEGGLRETGLGPGEILLAGQPLGELTGRLIGAPGAASAFGSAGGGGFGGMGFGGAMGVSGAMPGAASGPAPAPGDEAAAPTEQPTAQTAAQPQASMTAPQRRPAVAGRDAQLLAMIRTQEANRAAQVAMLRENAPFQNAIFSAQEDAQVSVAVQQQAEQQARQGQQAGAPPVLSEAELARQEKALGAAYKGFQGIRDDYPHTPTAEQARGEILVMVSHWRGLAQWERAAQLAKQFLGDNPTDVDTPKIRLEIARDWLAWAAKPVERKPTKQAMLAEVSQRFARAREQLAGILADFPKERAYRQQAQWDAANSFLTQARVVDAFSPTLARGQYVRAAKELQTIAADHPDHPQIGQIAQMLWGISQQLEGRRYFEEAVLVWNDLTIHYPMDALAQQAALKIAQTYHQNLERPLRAAEAYQELNFARGGSDQDLQNSIFQIGSQLKDQKRWVEALHVLGMFVDSFPRHPQAGTALTMIGQIHQTNEAWEDAIAAYRRVIEEFENGQWVKDAKWAIAECRINLSQWDEATEAYRKFVEAYGDDAQKVAEANRRIEVLKDLARYQALVDEKGQRKAFDAQYQIAAIVGAQLANRVKAIIEYRKVVAGWPQSHLADDALYAVGSAYLDLGETEKAREALLAVAEKYGTSPLADDALFLVGKSYEEEADKLATVTREESIAEAKDIAQRYAYEQVQFGRRKQEQMRGDVIAGLKAAGKSAQAEVEEARQAANVALFNEANVRLFAQQAGQKVETLTATQLADRQDKINAALRKAVDAYTSTSEVAGADKAGEALLQMATIYDQRLKDAQAAMATWLEIVRQFSGTAVAEDASWRIAQTYERQQEFAKAVEAYQAFLRNYRRSPNAGQAQFAVAENYERLNEWVNAMDSYTNYLNNFPEGPLTKKAQEQINWIKTYRL